MKKGANRTSAAICCALASILHFLTNGGIFLKQEVYIHVKVAGLNAPGHTTHNLSGGERKEEWEESGEEKVKWTGKRVEKGEQNKRGAEEEIDKEEEGRVETILVYYKVP